MKYLLSIFIIIFFTSCGGGTTTTTTSNNILTSYFIDSAVEGVDYKCGNIIGTTQANGKFTYTKDCGEVIFYIGNITIGTINSNIILEKTYPSHLVNTSLSDTNNEKVVNILRVLQSLDTNNNVYDGIEITQDTKEKLSTYKLTDLRDLSLDDTSLQNIVQTAISNRTLIDVNSSISNYELSLRIEENINIDTVAPTIPKLKTEFLQIDLKQTNANITILGEPDTQLYISYDDNISWNIYDQVNSNGELNVELSFNDTNQTINDLYLKLVDSNNNESNILNLHILRRDLTPPKIEIDNTQDNDNAYEFRFDEKEIFSYNISATDNSNGILKYSIVDSTNDYRSEEYDYFKIDELTGTLEFITKPDYDAHPDKIYDVVIKVTDEAANSTTAYLKVIPENKLDNPPYIKSDEFSTVIKDHSLNGTIVYDLNNTLLWDHTLAPDNDLELTSFRFYLLDNTDKFEVDQNTGIITIKNQDDPLFDFEQDPNDIVLNFMIENDNNTSEGNQTSSKINISISNINDTAPKIKFDTTPISTITEKISIGSNLAKIVSSAINLDDPKEDDYRNIEDFKILNYIDFFDIDDNTGNIYVKSSLNNLYIENIDNNDTFITLKFIATNKDESNNLNILESEIISFDLNITNIVDIEPKITLDTTVLNQEEQIIDNGFSIGNIITTGTTYDENHILEYDLNIISEHNCSSDIIDTLFTIDTNGAIIRDKNLSCLYTENITGDSSDITLKVIAKNEQGYSNEVNVNFSITNVIDNIPVIKMPENILYFEENYQVPLISNGTELNTTIYNISPNGTILDENNITKYNIISGNIDNIFSINDLTGEIKLAKLFDYETLNSYNLCFNATNIWFDGIEHNSENRCLDINVINTIEQKPSVTIIPETINIHENISNKIDIGLIRPDSDILDEQNITSISIVNGNDGNFLENLTLEQISSDSLQYAKIKTSESTNFDYESNNSYTLDINISNDFGSIIKQVNVNIIDDVDTDIPLVIIAMQFNDINITESVANTKNKVFDTSIESVNKYMLNISNNKFKYIRAEESYVGDGVENDGYIKVDINDTHPLDDKDKLNNYIYDAIELADQYINYKSYDENNNSILDKNELKILLISAGGEINYGDINKSIYGNIDILDTPKIYQSSDDINITIGIGNYPVVGEKQNDQYSTIGLISKLLSNTTFDFPISNNIIIYNYFDLMGEGFRGHIQDQLAGTMPTHPSCFNKSSQGWVTQYKILDKEVLSTNSNDYNITFNTVNNPNQEGINCMRIDTSDQNIYYLIENRNTNIDANIIFYDNGLYALNNNTFNGGIIIWKVDQSTEDTRINLIPISNSTDNVFRESNIDGDLNNNLPTNDFTFNTPPNDIDNSEESRQYTIGINIP